MSESKERCPTCGGDRVSGQTTFTADLGFGVIVIRDVPATVCDQCGEEWLDDQTLEHIEHLVDHAKQAKSQLEMVSFKQSVAG